MRRALRTACLLASCLALPAAAASACSEGSVNLLLGGKALNREDWTPFEDQGEVGLMLTFGGRGWPVLAAVDLVGSRDEETVVTEAGATRTIAGSTGEVNVGVRKEWGRRSVHPYFGGGLTYVRAKIESVGANDAVVSSSHGGVGLWFGAGAYWRLGRSVNLGFSLRATVADGDVNMGNSVAMGGGHVALLVGYSWPPRRH
jgi:hypothetical protein